MNRLASIQRSMFFCDPIDGGYTWTLASLLGDMLTEAQNRYGERDLNYTILGIEFSPHGPQIWYPNSCKNIIIQLSESAALSIERACYQLAHECIHLLAPSGGRMANCLEEGIASVFAEDYIREFGFTMKAGQREYQFVRDHTRDLLKLRESAVRDIRAIQPAMYKLTKEDIQKGVPEIPEDLAALLASPFGKINELLPFQSYQR